MKCPNCGNEGHDGIVGVQYEWNHPQVYDGISEYHCRCGTRWGRWSGTILLGSAFEYRYGLTPTSPTPGGRKDR